MALLLIFVESLVFSCIIVGNVVTFSMNTSLFLCARATLTCWKFLQEYCVH